MLFELGLPVPRSQAGWHLNNDGHWPARLRVCINQEPDQGQDVAQAQASQLIGSLLRAGQVFRCEEEDGGDFREYTLALIYHFFI